MAQRRPSRKCRLGGQFYQDLPARSETRKCKAKNKIKKRAHLYQCCLLYPIPYTAWSSLKLRLQRTHQLLHPSKPVIILQALRIKQRATRLDHLAGDDLLDGQLDLFHIDGGLLKRERGESQRSYNGGGGL